VSSAYVYTGTLREQLHRRERVTRPGLRGRRVRMGELVHDEQEVRQVFVLKREDGVAALPVSGGVQVSVTTPGGPQGRHLSPRSPRHVTLGLAGMRKVEKGSREHALVAL